MAYIKNLDQQAQLLRDLSDAAIRQIYEESGSVFNLKFFFDSTPEVFSVSDHTHIRGDNGANLLTGTNGDDVISAHAGNDVLLSYEGHDTLVGGRGDDTMLGGNGNDSYYVDSFLDVVLDSEVEPKSKDVIYTEVTYYLAEGSMIESLSADDINSTITIHLTGASRSESVTGNAASNILIGLGGDDFLFGNAGSDWLEGGADSDDLDGGAGVDTMIGGTGNDYYVANSIKDVIVEKVGEGNDTVGVCMSYTLGPKTNLENLSAVEGFNVSFLRGNEGDNRLKGNSGVNRLIGDGGRDEFSIWANATAVDKIADFYYFDDTIRLWHTNLSPNQVLKEDQFVRGDEARDGESRVIYDHSSGHLYFDQDGTGLIGQKLIAILENKPTINASDFFIIN